MGAGKPAEFSLPAVPNQESTRIQRPTANRLGYRHEIAAIPQFPKSQILLQSVDIVETELHGAGQGAQSLIAPASERVALGLGVEPFCAVVHVIPEGGGLGDPCEGRVDPAATDLALS